MSGGLSFGDHHALGAQWDGEGVNFALFSAHAEKVELCLFDPGGRTEIARHVLPEQTHDIWHGYLREHRNVWGTLNHRIYPGWKFLVITDGYTKTTIKVRMVAPHISVLSCMRMGAQIFQFGNINLSVPR